MSALAVPGRREVESEHERREREAHPWHSLFWLPVPELIELRGLLDALGLLGAVPDADPDGMLRPLGRSPEALRARRLFRRARRRQALGLIPSVRLEGGGWSLGFDTCCGTVPGDLGPGLDGCRCVEWLVDGRETPMDARSWLGYFHSYERPRLRAGRRRAREVREQVPLQERRNLAAPVPADVPGRVVPGHLHLRVVDGGRMGDPVERLAERLGTIVTDAPEVPL